MPSLLLRALLATAALAIALLAAAVVAVALALQHEPAVAERSPPDADDVGRALRLLRAHNPKRALAGAVSVVDVGQRDLEVLLNHGAWRFLGAATKVELQRGTALFHASVPLPEWRFNPFGRWVNVQARFEQTGGLPAFASWRVGRVPLPARLGERALLAAAGRAGLLPELQLAADVVRRVEFGPQRAVVVYAWRLDSADRVVEALLPPGEADRLRAYNARLVDWAARQPATPWTASAAPALATLFALARERSAVPGADPAAENRTAIVALTLYANGRGIDALLPAAGAWPRPRPLRLLLGGRDDFALHFLVSAALAAAGTGPLSQAIGIYKEIADSRGGSGFSFNDIAADRAGTRFGDVAVEAPQRLQSALARGLHESDVMPPVADLPEFMPEAEFVRRYGGVGAPPYAAMLADIDRRVAALPAFN